MAGRYRQPREEVVMTACKRGDESIVRIDRVRETTVDHQHAHYVAEGPFKGIVINPPSPETITEDEPPHVRLAFYAYLDGKAGHAQERERRELRFWFKSHVERATREDLAKKYFRSLLQPEAFPRDYVSFFKKAVVLSQRFILLRRLDVAIRPAPSGDSDYLNQEDEVELSASSPLSAEYSAHRLEYLAAVPQSGRKFDDEASDEEEESDDIIENFITVLTPAVYDYQYLPEVPVSTKSHIVFRLKASADAHVALSSVYGDTERKTYEVVIGGWNNTNSAIRLGGMGEVVEKESTPDIIDGEDSRSFWISWDRGMVQLGTGRHRGHDILMRWNIPSSKQHSVNCLAVSTGPGSEGEWEFVEKILPSKPEDETKKKKVPTATLR